ncbi:MAG TPA: hypothetical protein VFV78_12355 [Vicinamibacterales bacterium]|nr:hypothetical protein [Vicinamibacterales bacterium]
MKRLALVPFIVSVALAAACGADTRDSLAAEQQKVMEEFVTALDGVKDADTARSAKPKLQSIVARMEDINTRESKLPPPTDAETKALLEKHGKSMQDTMMKLQGSMMRIMMDPGIQAELKDIDFQKVSR